MKKQIAKNELPIRIVFYILCALYGGLCLYLFYNQSIQQVHGDSLLFESDLPSHISMVVDDGWYYSLTAFIYAFLYKIAGGTVLIAVFLALVAAGTVIATQKLLELIVSDRYGISCAGALALNFVMPFFVKWAGMYRYVSYQSPNVWHNSTYIVMRLCAVIFMYFYVKYEKDYAEKTISFKRWLILALLLALTTFVKPSFLTVFAPALALKLLWDLIKNKVKFLRAFLMGIIVVPSMLVILWQNSVLFGKDTDSGYKISFMETFSFHADHPKVTVVLSVAFPVVVFVCLAVETLIRLAGDKTYIFSLVMAVIGFAEAILLIETGHRSKDGNFLWGYSVALFFLYLTSFKKWYGFIKERKWIPAAVCGAVFAYQIVCGAIFFTRLVSGETYFMIG
ncbi:MAG: hypothetical protein IJ195_05795 [Lachnospiraceae bacterium]|nr:hypothetical protein [Lachnospiraceae bacterium]